MSRNTTLQTMLTGDELKGWRKNRESKPEKLAWLFDKSKNS